MSSSIDATDGLPADTVIELAATPAPLDMLYCGGGCLDQPDDASHDLFPLSYLQYATRWAHTQHEFDGFSFIRLFYEPNST